MVRRSARMAVGGSVRDGDLTRVCRVAAGHVLITTYSGTRLNQEVMCEVDWEYAVLDEGDKIRNPDADITLACKRLRVPSSAFSWHHMACFFLAEAHDHVCGCRRITA